MNEADIVASWLLGEFRRDFGWDEWAEWAEWAENPPCDNRTLKLGPCIHAGGERSVARVRLRIAERARRTDSPPRAASGQPKRGARVGTLRRVWPGAFVSLALALALAGCTSGLERPPVTPAATVIGEARSCVPLQHLRETRIRDDWTVDFIADSGSVWRNTLPGRCSGLRVGNSFTYETSLSQLCNTDIIYVLEPAVDLHRGRSCGLGEFVPVKLEK